jgi:hypothetical protein
LARFDRFHASETRRQQRQEVFQSIRLRSKDHYGNLATSQILLVFDPLIDREEHVVPCDLCRSEKFAILKASQPGKARGLAIVAAEKIPQPLIYALV